MLDGCSISGGSGTKFAGSGTRPGPFWNLIEASQERKVTASESTLNQQANQLNQEQSMPLNSYVTLGKSGLRISPFCLGTMTFGEDWGWGATPEDSSKILGAFLERGGNFVDTANFYTKGHSEKIIGDFIAQDPARRERMVLATKLFNNLYPGDPNGGGAGRTRHLVTEHAAIATEHVARAD
jgi:hypothetical protein